MEIAVLHAEKDTNTEPENVLERNTEAKIVLEKPKKPYNAKPMFIAQLMETGLNMVNGLAVAKHAAKVSKHVLEPVINQNTEERFAMVLQKKSKNVFLKRNVYTSQLVHAKSINWKNSLA